MADPVTWMAIGTGVSAMGSLQSASGMRAAGAQARRTAEYNASIRERNAKVAEQNADLRERVGDREVIRFEKKFSKLQARAGTAYRKSGVVASSDTPLEVMMRNANEAEEEKQLIGLAARTEAGQMREAGVNERLAGQLAILEGRARQQAYNTQARGEMFNAVKSIAFGGYQMSQMIS